MHRHIYMCTHLYVHLFDVCIPGISELGWRRIHSDPPGRTVRFSVLDSGFEACRILGFSTIMTNMRNALI